MTIKKFISCLSMMLLLGVALQAQTVDEIIANYFENTGGIDTWKNLQTIKMTGTVPSPQGDFPFTIYNKRPNKTKLEIDIQGNKLIPQAFDGKVAWGLNPFAGGTTAQKLPEDMTKIMEEQAEFDPIYLNYKEKGHEITLEGKEEIDGVECFKLKVERNKNNEREAYTEYHFFDTENFVPIMYRTPVRLGPSKGMETETYLSDYQEVEGGLIMPFYIESRTNGQVGQKIVIETITVNEDLPDELFAYPETKTEEETKDKGGK
ncbi:MAG: hypothetical protein D6730_13195 [Bacteroidetes bacterium]|nr:MAG: hypothetical protein D6730_13195 [Bacteroidota bacterium]